MLIYMIDYRDLIEYDTMKYDIMKVIQSNINHIKK